MLKSIRYKILSVIVLFSIILTIVFLVSQMLSYMNYRKSKISEIEKITLANVEKINRSVCLMENCAMSLAMYGSYYQQTYRNNRTAAEDAMKRFLVSTFRDFRIAIGGGIWYEPYTLDPGTRLYGPYAFFDKGKVVFTWDLNTEKYNYPGQDWYTYALPKDWNRNSRREKTFYWTAPYTDESGTNSLMITVDAFMYGPGDRIIGLSTVDWSLDEIIKFLNQIRITPSSKTFLADLGSRKIITYTVDDSMVMKDISGVPLLDEISRQENSNERCSYRKARVGKTDYHVFSILTASNMIYGVMIPDNEFLAETVRAGVASMAVSVILLIILIVTMNFIVGKQLSPMKRINVLMKEIAEGGGDLTRSINIKADDEIGEFAGSFNEFMDKIKAIASTIIRSAEHLTRSSSDLNDSSSNLSDNANRQASTSEQMTSTVEELSAVADNTAHISGIQNEKFNTLSEMVSSLSDNAMQLEAAVRESLDLSLKISQEALSGDAQLKLMNSSMEKITESSQKMTGIIGIINDISDRINLLSLNAAIEAARAGDAGKGFAVVADEISKLADQTSTSIKDIDSLIRLNKNEITQGMDTVLKSIEILGNITNQVSNISGRMKGIFKNTEEQINIKTAIGQQIDYLQDLSSQIKNASEEQKFAFQEIVKAITEVSSIAQSTASSAEQVSDNAGSISELSRDISNTVSTFKT